MFYPVYEAVQKIDLRIVGSILDSFYIFLTVE